VTYFSNLNATVFTLPPLRRPLAEPSKRSEAEPLRDAKRFSAIQASRQTPRVTTASAGSDHRLLARASSGPAPMPG
jgi:hypothetical protein